MQHDTNVFDYIKREETNFKTTSVPIADGYEWSMYEHIRKSVLYRDSKFTEGDDDGSRPYKNIIRRIINFQHHATGFDLKDINPFINASKNKFKSFLTRKYHGKWARKHDIDTFIDDMVESYVDFGGALIKHSKNIAPEVVPLQSLAFCDQTDILSGPICIKHQYSPSQLKEMSEKGWKNVEEVIKLAKREKIDAQGKVTKTPGKFIEVYELDGDFPTTWLDDEEDYDEDVKYSRQIHIITFYQDEKGNKKGVPLFQSKGDKNKYKFIARDKIFGRALGFGGVEELFESQVWTNYNMIRIQEMLDAASKVIHLTTDSTLATRNKISEMENNEFLLEKEGANTRQLNTQPVNLIAFQNAVNLWEQHAQGVGSAYDAALGESPSSGTPFKLQELVTIQGKSIHEYRKGKVATFLGEIYRDWILKDLVSEMNKEQEFMEELDLEEMEYIANSLANKEAGRMADEMVLSGEAYNSQAVEAHKQMVKDEFKKGGSKQFFKLLKDELKTLPIDVEVNIAGKQKNLALLTDKLTNVFRMVIANPQVLQNPPIAKIFNQILESSGMDEVDFSGLTAIQPQAGIPSPMQGQPLLNNQ